MRPAEIQDATWPVGPTGTTRMRIVRPVGAHRPLPLLMYFHGGGWMLADTFTHDRIVRELADAVHATVVFVDYINAPYEQYGTQGEQAYAALLYAVAHARELRVDPRRVAVAGDSVGGNMAAAIALMAKERRGPHIRFQALLYPLVDGLANHASYRKFGDDPWLTASSMQALLDPGAPDGHAKDTTFPLGATIERLRGLPDALVVTDDDALRQEGEAYAARLGRAGVRVTAVHYSQSLQDFALLNPLADTPATRGAVQQAIVALRGALHN